MYYHTAEIVVKLLDTQALHQGLEPIPTLHYNMYYYYDSMETTVQGNLQTHVGLAMIGRRVSDVSTTIQYYQHFYHDDRSGSRCRAGAARPRVQLEKKG